MIISASYRTDIPAFYGKWFMNRLNAGFCRVVNPYGGPVMEVRLNTENISGFVFWTKNIGPFLESLSELKAQTYPFTIQYTINNYPTAIEAAVPDWRRSTAHMRMLASAYGSRAVVWRYDPVVITSLTPIAWHYRNFNDLAREHRGTTDEVVISFAHIYRKTRRNLDMAASAQGFSWCDPEIVEKREMTAQFSEIAEGYGIRLTVCSQPEFQAVGIEPSSCIDALRLGEVAGHAIAVRVKGNRPGCLCHQSRDIGAYDTCPMGCVYCYAVASRERAEAAISGHDAAGAFMCPPRNTAAGNHTYHK